MSRFNRFRNPLIKVVNEKRPPVRGCRAFEAVHHVEGRSDAVLSTDPFSRAGRVTRTVRGPRQVRRNQYRERLIPHAGKQAIPGLRPSGRQSVPGRDRSSVAIFSVVPDRIGFPTDTSCIGPAEGSSPTFLAARANLAPGASVVHSCKAGSNRAHSSSTREFELVPHPEFRHSQSRIVPVALLENPAGNVTIRSGQSRLRLSRRRASLARKRARMEHSPSTATELTL
jgi:hypothetical protein